MTARRRRHAPSTTMIKAHTGSPSPAPFAGSDGGCGDAGGGGSIGDGERGGDKGEGGGDKGG